MAKAMLGGELMFPSEYVAAAELKGQDRSATISKVERAELMVVGGAKKPGVVVHFKETPKKLVLNKTNAATIADMHGSEAEKWVGKRVTLFPDTCKCKGKVVDCIRIRDVIPPAKGGNAAPAPAPEPAKDWPAHCVIGKPGCESDPAAYSTGPDGKPVCANHAR